MSDKFEDLERLGRLKESGVISEEEFELEKSKVLSGSTQSRKPIVLISALLLAGVVAAVAGWLWVAQPNSDAEGKPDPVATGTTDSSNIDATEAAPTEASRLTPVISAEDNLVTQGPVSWVGRYDGPFEENMTGVVNISEGAGGALQASVSIGGPDCSGDIEGPLTVQTKNQAVIRLPEDESGKSCTVTFNRYGQRIELNENDCGYYHGAQCIFSGVVNK